MHRPFENSFRAVNEDVALAGIDEIVFDVLQLIANGELVVGRVAHMVSTSFQMTVARMLFFLCAEEFRRDLRV